MPTAAYYAADDKRVNSVLVERPANSARLVGHLAAVGCLRTAPDRHFFFVAAEMARLSGIPLDQLLTDLSHPVGELRSVCFHVLGEHGKMDNRSIAKRFKRARSNIQKGRGNIVNALRNPVHYQPLVRCCEQLTASFTAYLISSEHEQ